MADHRPNVYQEDGVWIIRASSLGMCKKSLTACGMGMTGEDHPEWLKVKFEQGVDGEPVVIEALSRWDDERNDTGAGWRFADEATEWWRRWDDGQVLVEMPVGTKAIVRGHMDGLATCYIAREDSRYDVQDKRMVEVKCVSPDYSEVILRSLPLMYAVQITVYMHWVGEMGMLALGVKDEEGVVEKVVTRDIPETPVSIGWVKARVNDVVRRIESGELGRCDVKTWPCAYPWLCDDVAGVEGATGDGELYEKLVESVEKIRGGIG